MSTILKLAISFLIAFLGFLALFQLLSPVTETAIVKEFIEKKVEVEPPVRELSLDQLGSDIEQQLRCLENPESCLKKEKQEKSFKLVSVEVEKKVTVFTVKLFSEIEKGDLVINLIFLTIFITLWLQIFILLLSKDKKILESLSYRKRKIVSNSLEFTINAPSVLGVMGTIYAFALFTSEVGGVDSSSIVELFTKNFISASLTTLLGISVYIINLAIQSFIELEEEKSKRPVEK